MAAAMAADAENRLLASVLIISHHQVLRPLFPPIIIRRPGMRRRPDDRGGPITDALLDL